MSFLCACVVFGQNTFDPDDVVDLKFTIGDGSGSHSERWLMNVAGGPTTLRAQSPDYGQIGTTNSNQFRKGNTYSITVDHQGTSPGYEGKPSPDYDYTAKVETSSSVGYLIVDEAQPKLLGTSNGSETNEASGKTAYIAIPKPLLSFTDYTEEEVEGDPGVLVLVNDNDSNEDGDIDLDSPYMQDPDYVEIKLELELSGAVTIDEGIVRLSANTSDLRAWDSADGSTPLSLPIEWDMSTNEGDLFRGTGKTIYLEALDSSQTYKDVTLKFDYKNHGTTTDEADITLLKVDLEAYKSIDDFSPIANHISNDVQTAPEPTPEEERTVLVEFSPSDFFQSHSDRISFEISSITPDTSPNKGSIDDTDFKSSGGTEPVRYIAKFENQTHKGWDHPALQPQEVSIRVLLDGNEIFDVVKPPYNLITVYSRFDYLWLKYPGLSDSERASKAMDHVMWKYDLSFSFTPEYDGTMDSVGQTRAYGVDPPLLAPYGVAWDGVYLNSGAFASEQFVASVLVHENSHYEDGFGYAYLSSLGADAYFAWVAGGRTSTLSAQDVINIFAWIAGEEEAVLDQQAHPTYQYLKSDEIADIVTYLNDHLGYESDMLAHGYSI